MISTIKNRIVDDTAATQVAVARATPDLVKMAVKKLKADKSDVSGKFTPDIFYEKLSSLFRSCLVHGHISHELLVCALCPIVKDSNGDVSSSKNYRGIAISSLILKVFDSCVLLLFGSLLSNDIL